MIGARLKKSKSTTFYSFRKEPYRETENAAGDSQNKNVEEIRR